MQGLNQIDLARTMAEERLHPADHYDTQYHSDRRHAVRQWLGNQLIRIGESLAPKPTELQLKASTGPPCC